jgi:hypothetical protein
VAKGAFGLAVVAACEARGVSQSDLARELGISNGHLSDCLRANRVFPQSLWVKLTKELPNLTLEQVAELAFQTWPVKVDAMRASTEDRKAMAEVLARIVRKTKR